MRIITNEGKLKRNRTVGQVLFFVSLGLLIGGLVLNVVLSSAPTLFWLAPCIVMPLALITTIFAIRMANEYNRAPYSHTALNEGLKGINPKSILYHYFRPTNHILVSPQGVYTMRTLFQNRRFSITGDKWSDSARRGFLAPMFQYLKQENIGNPFKEAEDSAKAVQHIVDQVLPNSGIEVQSMVVMLGPQASLELDDERLPVVFANARIKPSLRALIREDKKNIIKPLSDQEIQRLHEAILATEPNATISDIEA